MTPEKVRYSLNFKSCTDEDRLALYAKLNEMSITYKKAKWWVDYWHCWMTGEELLIVTLTFGTLTITVSANQFDYVDVNEAQMGAPA
jgi:hypothetical protein